MISPPAGCREELQIPRSRDDGGSGYRRFHGDLIGCLGFRHRGLLIGEGGGRGGGQGAHTLPRREPTPGHALGGVWPPWYASPSTLWTYCSPRKVIDFEVCPVQFREYFFTSFSETK